MPKDIKDWAACVGSIVVAVMIALAVGFIESGGALGWSVVQGMRQLGAG